MEAESLSVELDLKFYRAWYSDLRALDTASLTRHWKKFGRNEGRAPSFAALLAKCNLDISTLAGDFSVETHSQQYPALTFDPEKCQWEAALHYLSNARHEEKPLW